MFISTAYAQTAPAAAGSPTEQLMGFLPMLAIFAVMYFLMIRPQMKRAKEHKAMLEAIKKGDEVVTSGGIVGRIVRVTDSFVCIETAGDKPVELQVQKAAVQTLLPNGTLKSI